MQLTKDYNDVDIEGEGEARIFQNGNQEKGIWRKSPVSPKTKLEFLDEDNNETLFVRGSMWIQIVEPGTEVIWASEGSPPPL